MGPTVVTIRVSTYITVYTNIICTQELEWALLLAPKEELTTPSAPEESLPNVSSRE